LNVPISHIPFVLLWDKFPTYDLGVMLKGIHGNSVYITPNWKQPKCQGHTQAMEHCIAMRTSYSYVNDNKEWATEGTTQ
jgi:hypothetical protein